MACEGCMGYEPSIGYVMLQTLSTDVHTGIVLRVDVVGKGIGSWINGTEAEAMLDRNEMSKE